MKAFFEYKMPCFIIVLLAKIFEVYCELNDESTSLNPISENLEQNVGILSLSREADEYFWIRHDYEFGSGPENNEELLITGIDSKKLPKVQKDIKNWQTIEYNDKIYIAGIKENTLFLYHIDSQTSLVSLHANLVVSEKIKTFKIINLLHDIDSQYEQEKVYVVLYVTEKNNHYLKWYHLKDRSLIYFRTWSLKKPLVKIEYFNFNNREKLLLLYEEEKYFQMSYSLVEIYNVNIHFNRSQFSLCYQILIQDSENMKLCRVDDEKTTISFQNKNEIVLYEYRDEDMIKCIFDKIQSIAIEGLDNYVCYEDSNHHYLATSGFTPKLFKYRANQFVMDEKIEKFLEGKHVDFIQSLPLDTYREDVLLLVQLKNSKIITFNWNGIELNQVSLSSQILEMNYFDLKEATVIPKFGFIYKNTIIKLNYELKWFSKLEDNEFKKMLETKSVIEDLLKELESVEDELSKINKLEINEMSLNDTDDSIVQVGTHNYTFDEFNSSYMSFVERIDKLEEHIKELENVFKNTTLKNNSNTYFDEINITGDFEVKGSLTVNKLEMDNLNGIPLNYLMDECRKTKNTKISGVKSFPQIIFSDDKFKIKYLNNIPLENYEFYDQYYKMNFTFFNNLSNVTKLEIKKNLDVSRLSGFNWEELTKNVIYKNKQAIINGSIEVLGEISANFIQMDYLNNVRYPNDYVVKSGPEVAYMAKEKTFEVLKVSDLQGVETINDIDANDFIVLNVDQNLSYPITFQNLIIDESLQIDGKIIGLPGPDFDPDLTLLNSNNVQSNVVFNNVYISGNIYVEKLVNNTPWSKFDDLIFRGDKNVSITGTKTFLGNVHIAEKLEIETEKINGVFSDEFVTIDTLQTFPNLSRISGNVEFTEVGYEDLKNLEDNMNANVGSQSCVKKKSFLFAQPAIVDEFSVLNINDGQITGKKFAENLEKLMQYATFDYLNVGKLIVENLLPKMVNGIDFKEFEEKRITKSGYQIINGDIVIKNLDIQKLYADRINGKNATYFQDTVNRINMIYDNIMNGEASVASLTAETVITPRINNQDMNHEFKVNDIDKIIFRSNKSINDIVVDGFVNNVNFTYKIQDTVLKNDDNVFVSGKKKIKNLKTRNLRAEFINGRPVVDVLSASSNQTLRGPVKIKGSVIVRDNFNSTRKINDVPFKDIGDVIQKVDGKSYKLKGDFLIHDYCSVKNLNVHGEVQKKRVDELMENLVYVYEENVEITGTKYFNNSVHFFDGASLSDNFEYLDLQKFYENVIFIDHPISLENSIVVFDGDIMIENDLTVRNSLKTESLKGINVDELRNNVIYLNRPVYIAEGVKFANVVFKSDVTLESWNDVKVDTLFKLHTDEFLPDGLMCIDAYAENIELYGFVNGENLTEFYLNTFMLSGDQAITGKFSFLNQIYVNNNFYSRFINKLDITQAISLNDDGPLIGDFVFDNPLIVNGNFTVLKNLNGVDFPKWLSTSINTNTFRKQVITANLVVHGNVTIEQNVTGSGSINGRSIQKLASSIQSEKSRLESSASNKMEELKKKCFKLKKLKETVENTLYKFKSFENFKELEFDQTISSFHHFQFKNVDYIIINFESSTLRIYRAHDFELVLEIHDLGIIHQYITLNYKNEVYFVTIGQTSYQRSSGNIWSFEKNNFKHVMDIGDVLEMKKLDDTAFVVLLYRQVQEWTIVESNGILFKRLNVIPINSADVKFFSVNNETMLASRDSIYALRTDRYLEFEELENTFGTNNILTLVAGTYKKQFLLNYEEKISPDYIFISTSNLDHRKILQTLKVHRPSSFILLNFDKFIENLLIFVENKSKIQIYEYKGIEGFKHHSSIKMNVDKLYQFELANFPNTAKQHYLAVVQDKKLTMLEAKMYGERLHMKDDLVCE